MGNLTGRYVSWSSAELSALKTKLQTARDACLTAHQSYTRPGHSFNRVEFQALTDELAEVEYAIQYQAGNVTRRTYADLDA